MSDPGPGPSRRPKRKDAIKTRKALLAAATECFSRHGYEATNMRQVCARAKANLGAVRHYFGNKEALYLEVLVLAHQELVAREPLPRMGDEDDPRQALHRWVRYLLRIFLLRRAEHPQAGRLIALEMRDPTPALDQLINKVLLPIRQELDRIVARLLGPADEPRLRTHCVNFVHGICVFHDQSREYLTRIGRPVPSREEDVEALAGVIVEFALAGIEGLRSSATTHGRGSSNKSKEN